MCRYRSEIEFAFFVGATVSSALTPVVLRAYFLNVATGGLFILQSLAIVHESKRRRGVKRIVFDELFLFGFSFPKSS